MARFKEIVDLYFTASGDFFLDDNGDLLDTKNELMRGFIQRIDTRIRSSKFDWRLQSNVGVGLQEFVGKPNTRDLGQLIKARVYSELVAEDLLRSGEFQVDVMPISEDKLMIAIIIRPPQETGQVLLTYHYDLRDNSVIPRNIE